MFFQKIRKITVGFLLSIFVFSSLAGFIISAQPANAQLATVVAGDVPAQAQGILDLIKNGWKIAVLNAAQQAVSYFLRKVAYDSAVWLASGGKGQGSLAQTKGFGSYLKDAGSEAAGTAIEQLGKGFGLDLCKIPDVKLDLALRIGLHYNFATGNEPRKPACNLESFVTNWGGDAWASKYGDGQGGFDVNKVFNKSIAVDDSPLGITMKTTEKIDRLVAKQTNAASQDRIEGQGFKTAAKLISGDVKTPSQVIKKESEANAPSEQNKKSETQIAAAMGSGAYEIIPSTLSLFLNTLSGQMLKNFKENGMLPGGICVGSFGGPDCKNAGAGAGSYDAGGAPTGRAVAEAAFSEFLTTKLDSISNYDILAELNSCEARGLYNCRADQGLVQAIQEGKQANGSPVTIKEAIDKGWLHGRWKLIPPSRVAENTDQNCYNNNYCYSNLQVLRQLRIFPLGLEIAAKNSDPDHPATLNDVVNGFYDCNYVKDGTGKVVGINYDPENKPFCHLVDPNWVIKLTQTRCDAMAYGSTPLSTDVPDRVKECVNLKTCVGQDSSGNCAGYGDCVREKNVWKFDADKCDAQYATCRSFTDSAGKSVSYLYRSLDTGDCSQDTAGCAAYSLEQDNLGKWKTVVPKSFGNYSTGIYLNKNVSTNCSASSLGCSAFKLSGDINSNNFITLKKAPDYLNCYDADLTATASGIQWPQTFSDIFQMQPRPECNDYAKVCIADEVGCASYQSADDSKALAIPGKFTPATVTNNTVQNWNDQCDSRCSGYAAYREMPSTYSSGTPLAYIIPPSLKYNKNESGKTCVAEDVGCSSFTNMATTEGGGEKIEYFTDLRACIKPDVNKQKNFYTYEGSIVGGYQLQAYTLEKNTTDDEDITTPGVQTGNTPATVFVNAQEKADAALYKCNAILYKAGQADADCRQFNDDKGVISYALLAHTVVVSADCAPYRLNSTELAGTGQCYNNGEYKDGACYYNGLPTGIATNAGSSQTCSAAAVSCREYKGNNGNNIKTLLVEKFENQSDVSVDHGWNKTAGTISWSTESTRAGDHSLGFAGSAGNTVQKSIVLKADSLDLQNNMSYSLSFWAKGSGVNVEVEMVDGNSQHVAAGTITANTSWQYFKFNLLELQSSGTSTINLRLKTNGNIFIDNVRLAKVSEFLYLVKDSLKVDPICDDNQTDNLPGAALGCSAYTGPKNSLGDNFYYLTNFSFLCREGAIGCTAFTDTFNKITDTGPRAYNVSLNGQPATTVTVQIGSDSYRCQIEQGKTSCLVNIKGHTKNEIETATAGVAQFVSSTYYIPADSASSTPIYLVADQSVSCSQANLGCTLAGLQKSTPSGNQFETTTIKLDPSQFEEGTDITGNPSPGILCHEKALGCGIYGSSQGDAFFKDPGITGSKICTYQTNVIKDSNRVSGWFWKGVGVCGNTSTLQVATPKKTCVSDDNCSVGGCIEKDIQACYPNYLQNGNSYGLWSFGNKDKYDNFVGECPAEQNACTEFVDHNDKDTAYYFLKNNKISEGNCGGVSQKAGCALFDQTDNPNKFWNTAATYMLSDNFAPGRNTDLSKVTKVQPVDQGASNDANIIIKVKRDRECAEWLQCSQSHTVWDESLSKPKLICDKFKRCDALYTNQQGKNDLTNCAEYVDGIHDVAKQILTAELYFDRDITWKGKDFAGFSVLGMYPLEELGQYNVATDGTEDFRLAKAIPCSGVNCQLNPTNQFACESTSTLPCGANGSGLCVNRTCLKDVDGTTENLLPAKKAMICRAYPEKDSPFPNSIFTDKQMFANVNICQEEEAGKNKSTSDLGLANKCECDYTKVVFGDGLIKKYWNDVKPNKGSNPIGSPGVIPDGICSGGLRDGKDCVEDKGCQVNINNDYDQSAPGSCQKIKKVSQFIGWRGYCLEKDLSRNINGMENENACLTWFPVDSLAGTKDINNQHKEAGFVPPVGSKYCLASEIYKKTATYGTCLDPAGTYVPDGDCSYDKCSQYINYCGNSYTTSLTCNGVAVGGQDCHHGGIYQNDCNITCTPKDANQWVGNPPFFSAINTIGCQAFSLVDSDNSAPWTNRIWENNKQPYTIVPLKPADSNTLNFTYKTTSSPFAYIPDSTTNLIKLQSCKFGLDFEKPFSNFTCPTSPKYIMANPKNSDGYQNFSYDGSWNYVVGSTCTDNAGCNNSPLVTCSSNTATALCKRSCLSDNDCKVSSSTYGNLGLCVGATPDHEGVCTDTNKSNLTCDNNNNTCINANNNLKAGNNNATSSANFCEGSCSNAPTKTCINNEMCYTKKCMGDNNGKQCVDLSVPVSAIAPKDVKTKILDGWNQFKQIFAKLSDVMSFNDASKIAEPTVGQTYQPLSVTNTAPLATVLDFAASAQTNTVPSISPVGACNGSGKCMQLGSGNFSINGISGKNVIIEAQPAEAVATFYAGANSEHMPIRKVLVDWNDGESYSAPTGYYRNQLGSMNANNCSATPGETKKTCKLAFTINIPLSGPSTTVIRDWKDAECKTIDDCKFLDLCGSESNAPAFGFIKDKTCDAGYFTYSHPYICKKGDDAKVIVDGKSQDIWQPDCAGNEDMQTAYGGCCVYQPKIQVKDNWGWCNGTCPGGVDGTTGCYNGKDADGTIIYECDTQKNTDKPFTSYGSKILVAPNKNSFVSSTTP